MTETCLCNIGAQECPVHPGNTWTQEEKIAFRKKWDQRVVESQRRNDDKEER